MAPVLVYVSLSAEPDVLWSKKYTRCIFLSAHCSQHGFKPRTLACLQKDSSTDTRYMHADIYIRSPAPTHKHTPSIEAHSCTPAYSPFHLNPFPQWRNNWTATVNPPSFLPLLSQDICQGYRDGKGRGADTKKHKGVSDMQNAWDTREEGEADPELSSCRFVWLPMWRFLDPSRHGTASNLQAVGQ